MLQLEAPWAGCVCRLVCTPLGVAGGALPPTTPQSTGKVTLFWWALPNDTSPLPTQWCSCSSFTSLDYFLLEYLQFSSSTQAIAIHEFLRKGRRGFGMQPSHLLLWFYFFLSFFHGFKSVWLEMSKGTHWHRDWRRFDWKSLFLSSPHLFGAWPMSQILMSQIAW